MTVRQEIPDLPYNMSIVDPKTGRPSQELMLWWQRVKGNEDFLNGELDAKADKTTEILAGTGLEGGGNLSGNVTLELQDTPVTPGTYGDATHVARVTVDQQGRLTDVEEVAISGGGGGGSLALIATQTLVADGPEIVFSAIPGTFKDLVLVGQLRSSIASTTDELRMQLNGDTAANYQFDRENRFGAASGAAVDHMEFISGSGATAPAGAASTFEAQFMNYATTTWHKKMFSLGEAVLGDGTGAGGIFRVICSGRWRSTAAITQIRLFSSTANLVTGSTASLYGRT